MHSLHLLVLIHVHIQLLVKKLNFTQCKLEATAILEQHFACVEIIVGNDADTPATCWLSTWCDCSNIYMWIVYSWCMPDLKVIWYSIESQSGKASVTVTVLVV